MPCFLAPALCVCAINLMHSLEDSPTSIVCCGAEQVFILALNDKPLDPQNVAWSWNAEDSRRIPKNARPWFRTTDDCKPLAESILITSSSGGVALIQRADKSCLFLTNARNAHSACMLPDQRIAVASSYGGDELLIYKIESVKDDGELKAADPIARMPLIGAHGAVWDKEKERLWALGGDKLCLVEIREVDGMNKLIVESEFRLPTPGGHDLSQLRNKNLMYVTTDEHVYQFDKAKGTFKLDESIGNQKRVKSVSEHPETGEVVYHMATSEHWWSDTIRFPGERDDVQLPKQRLYKVRWDHVK